jgi:hypothetical protein
MLRTSLLVRCSVGEADRVRLEAKNGRRRISAHVLYIVMRAVDIEELSSRPKLDGPDGLPHPSSPPLGPRTALLVRCTIEEAGRIREAAQRANLSVNAFILRCLNMAWDIDAVPLPMRVASREWLN